jgi:predicted kinase
MGHATKPRLILICGLPGAGKTTLARHLAVQLHAVRLSPDEWMAHLEVDPFDGPFRDRLETLFWVHTQELLRLGQSVILESGFWLRSDRDEKRLGARALGVPVDALPAYRLSRVVAQSAASECPRGQRLGAPRSAATRAVRTMVRGTR